MSALDGVRAKIERAEKHIADFNQARQAFFASNPYTPFLQVDSITGEGSFCVKDIKPTPLPMCAIVGDAIHNLRAALDLLACQLVRLTSITHDCSHVYFPIKDSSQQLEAAFREREIKLLGQAAIQIIQRLEPYKGGKRHELWVIHSLDILDKHRFLVIPLAGAKRIGFDAQVFDSSGNRFPSQDIQRSWSVPHDLFFVLKHGDKVFGVTPRKLFAPDVEAKVDFKLSGDIVFNEPGIIERKAVLNSLITFVDIVNDTVDKLEPCFL